MPGTPEYRVYEFERYAMRVEVGQGARSRGDDQNDQLSGPPAWIRRRAISPSSHGGSAFR